MNSGQNLSASPIFRRLVLICAGLILGLAGHLFQGDGSPISALERWMRDTSLGLLSNRIADPRIVLVDIDEASLKSVGTWPWSRAQLAALANALTGDLGAAIVGLDMVFPEPKDPAGDAALGRLAQARKLVLAQVLDYSERQAPIKAGALGGQVPVPPPTPVERSDSRKAGGFIANHSQLATAPCIGNIGFIPDSDGKLRTLIHRTEYENQIYPSFSLSLATCSNDQATQQPKNQTVVPSEQPLLFDISPEKWTVIPAHLILNSAKNESLTEELKALVQKRVVIVGSSAMGLSDRVSTPISSSISGMFVHAQALSELLSPRGYESKRWSAASTILFQTGLLIAMGIVVVSSKSLIWMFTGIILTLVTWGWMAVSQVQAGNPLNLTAPIWGFLFFGLVLIPLEWFGDKRKNRYISDVLARYVSKPVLREILSQSQTDPLKPRSAQITVLVADMASYSETVAGQSLDNSAAITRGFLEKITEPVWNQRGTLDRYTGDGLIAFWGAPIAEPNHAELTLKAAQEMLKKIKELNHENELRGLPSITLRIGIASGEALVGDFGTEKRANYTAVGNCINMASRLESAARDLSLNVLVSEETKALTVGQNLKSAGKHEIRGIGRVSVYTL